MDQIISMVRMFIGQSFSFIISDAGTGFVVMVFSAIFFLSSFQGKKIKGKVVGVEPCGKYEVQEGRNDWIRDLYIYTLAYDDHGNSSTIKTKMDSYRFKEGDTVPFDIEDGVASPQNGYIAFRILSGVFIAFGTYLMISCLIR